jgi:hypothetical protein
MIFMIWCTDLKNFSYNIGVEVLFMVSLFLRKHFFMSCFTYVLYTISQNIVKNAPQREVWVQNILQYKLTLQSSQSILVSNTVLFHYLLNFIEFQLHTQLENEIYLFIKKKKKKKFQMKIYLHIFPIKYLY